MGLDDTPPDEFVVVTRAPLALPPDFALRPPAPGAKRPQEPEVREQAREALVRNASPDAAPDKTVSNAEAALLKRAGAAPSDPAIRTMIDAESAALATSDAGFVERIMFWRDDGPPGEVIDAQEEAQRLRSATSAGASPTIKRREGGAAKGPSN